MDSELPLTSKIFRNTEQHCRGFEKEHLYLLPFSQKSRLATFTAAAGRRTDPPVHYSLERIQLPLLSAQTTANEMRDLRDYSTFSLYLSKQIVLQDQLPTSFRFFWLKGQQESFKPLGFFYFHVKFLLDEKAGRATVK